MAHRRHLAWIAVTATVLAVAVIVASAARAVSPRSDHELAAELLIARGDLGRLGGEAALSPQNREGLRQRIAGALGLLPWLLRQAGDAGAADRLRAWQQRSVAGADGSKLIAELDAAIARYPIDRAAFLQPAPTPARLSEARAIHGTYCAGCHDGAGNGAPGSLLPARDLFKMGRQEGADEFLARLVNGVKGDATVHFANPLTNAQIGALWTFYRTSAR